MRASTFHFSRASAGRRGNAGFTLIELMITLSIAAVLLATGLPSFTGFVRSQRVKTASFDFVAALNYARSEAIKRNANVVITQASSGANGWQSGWAITESTGGTTIGTHGALSSVSVTGPAAAVTYNNSGRINGTANAGFQIVAGADTRCITVDVSGLPKSKVGSC